MAQPNCSIDPYFITDGQTADQPDFNNALNDPIILRLVRSADNKSDTVTEESENEIPNTNKDEPTNQIINKEDSAKDDQNSQTPSKEDSPKIKNEQISQTSSKDDSSTMSNARSAESKKESSSTTAKPQAASGLPPGFQGLPTGNSKATLIFGTFQAIMMPMPDSPAGFPPAAAAG